MTVWAWVGLAGGLGFLGLIAMVVMCAGRQSEEGRRGGLLELDTPAARAAIADPDDWFGVEIVETGERAGSRSFTVLPPAPTVSPLRRCNPAKKTHFHGAGERCECGERPNVLPFAGGGDAA